MKIRIGTRGSALALRQTEILSNVFRSQGVDTEIVSLVSVGDKKQGTPAANHGDKRDWIAGLEEATLSGEVDLVLHSSKDVPLELLPGTKLLPVLTREYPFDVLVTREPLSSIEQLPRGAKLGTASLRRGAFLKAFRSDFEIVPIRGNITTRLEKLERDSALVGIILARAGLERLFGSHPKPTLDIPENILIPAMNQGTLAVQFAESRLDLEELIWRNLSRDTFAAWISEREVIRVLGADCHSAVGVYADIRDDRLRVRCRVCSVDGVRSISGEESGPLECASELGAALGRSLLEQGASEILRNEAVVSGGK